MIQTLEKFNKPSDKTDENNGHVMGGPSSAFSKHANDVESNQKSKVQTRICSYFPKVGKTIGSSGSNSSNDDAKKPSKYYTLLIYTL